LSTAAGFANSSDSTTVEDRRTVFRSRRCARSLKRIDHIDSPHLKLNSSVHN
jgi:hypothetical protein